VYLLPLSGDGVVSTEAKGTVAFQNVFKAFGPKQVLRNVSFTVQPGETLCILGRSGTGKSVTLKLLMALLKPDQGSIRVEQDDITRLDEKGLSKVRRKMGFLFQDAALFDSLTLYDNLALPLRRLTEKTEEEINFAIDKVLGNVGLGGDKEKMPAALSGGMRKRAGLARALVLEPQILLADETRAESDFEVNTKAEREIETILVHLEAQNDLILKILRHLEGAATPPSIQRPDLVVGPGAPSGGRP
jgi:phospholipid/cholesterol/gamma-HCH transport system ATP-binding protein